MSDTTRLGWKVYLGVSATTIQDGQTFFIQAYIPELSPNAKGDPTLVKTHTVKVKNPLFDTTETGVVPCVDLVNCQYFGGTNMMVPCIHSGEQILVLQYEGNENQFYWLPLGREPGIRRFENIRWFAMDQEEAITDIDKFKMAGVDSSYFINIDTNPTHKIIWIHSCQNNNEKYGYDIKIIPESNELHITDTDGNYFKLESAETRWTLHNKDNTEIILDKSDMRINVPRNLDITVGGNMTTKVTGTVTEEVGGNVTKTYKSDETIAITGDESVTISGKQSVKVSGDSVFEALNSAFNASASLKIDSTVTISGKMLMVGTSHGTIPNVIPW